MTPKKYDYRILALKWGLNAKNQEFVCYLTKQELKIQMEALKLAGYDSVISYKLSL
ncbi:MAG: hypothetical protein WC389_22330 [Lutibacter sp.]|jgi:hypothetical protein